MALFWNLRDLDDEFDLQLYGGLDDLFSIEIHHGGMFTKFPNRAYVKGQVRYADLLDKEHFSVHELNSIVKELGYSKKEVMFYHYKIPDQDLNFGLRALGNDVDVLGFLKYVDVHNRMMEIYIEHRKTDVETYFFSPKSTKVIIEEFDDDSPEPSKPLRTTQEITNTCRRRLALEWTDNVCNDTHYGKTLTEDTGVENDCGVVTQEGNNEKVVENVSAVLTQEGNIEKVIDAPNTQEGNNEKVTSNEYAQDDVFDFFASLNDDLFEDVFKKSVNENVFTKAVNENVFTKSVNEDVFTKAINEDVENVVTETGNENDATEEDDGTQEDDGMDSSDDSNQDKGEFEEFSSEELSDYIPIEDEEDLKDEDDDFLNFVDHGIEEEDLEPAKAVDEQGFEDDFDMDIDDFDSLTDEDNDAPLKRNLRKVRRKKKKNRDLVNEPFYVGQSFPSRDEIRSLVKKLAVDSRRQLKICRNDPKRFRVICEGTNVEFTTGSNESEGDMGKSQDKASDSKKDKKIKVEKASGSKKGRTKESEILKKVGLKKPRYYSTTCPWVLHVSNLSDDGSWVVKTFINEHTCLNTREVRLCTVSWLAREVESHVYVNPTIPLSSLQELLHQKFQIHVSRQKVFRAKRMAKRKLEGDYKAQYAILRNYCEELIRSNPGTTIKLDVESEPNPTSETRKFKRLYVCLQALKDGFKILGRRILGLDGCFMKGPYPGQLLCAVGLDSNNGIYPVAYALVESESRASWTWFLELLQDDLDLYPNSNFTFISDRQKGIIPAIEKVFPSAEHRYCLRHVHENMKSKWRGELYKHKLFSCANAPTVPYFEKAMKEVAELDSSLHDWLRKIPPKHWCKSHFSGVAVSDVLLNNLCEVFNRQLIGGRDKPIITCLEFIRVYIMKRIVAVHKIFDKCAGPLTPKATEIFDKIKSAATDCSVIWCGNTKYQVTGKSHEQYIVNFGEKSCTCRKWEITRIPCKHSVAVMWDMAQNGIEDDIPESYVSKVYWLETWKQVYGCTIEPINGRDMWPVSACPTKLLPPKYHKQIGRPKKKRKKTAEELSQPVSNKGKMVRLGGSITCANCGNKGHNKRSCKAQRGGSQAAV